MPLVRISLVKGKPEAYRRKVGDAIHRALVEALGVPPLDRFQLLTEHEPGDLVYDLQITLSAGRTLEQKRALYRRIATNLAAAVALRPQDAWINLIRSGEGELVFRQWRRFLCARAGGKSGSDPDFWT